MLVDISLTITLVPRKNNPIYLRLSIFNAMIEDGVDKDFELTWKGKSTAKAEAAGGPIMRLKHQGQASLIGHKENHLFIEGDNLLAMKALMDKYEDQVHQIYIDPPYNTGQTFVYNDNYSGHVAWLNMMLPRLILARKLLGPSGVIFVSIDDHEVANLKLIMDEVFGDKSYIDLFCWVKTETPANLSKKSKKVLEYILCYQKVKDKKKFKGIKKHSPSSNGLLNQTNKKGILKFPENVVRTKIKDGKIKAGKYGTDRYEIQLLNDTEIKDGLFTKPFGLKAKFKWTQPKLDKEIEQGTIISIPTDRLSPSYDKVSYDPEVPPNLINHKVGVATNEVASSNLIKLMGAKVFDFPKPISLLKYLLGFNDIPDGIIMDFFAGSGATMQAVMEMNADDKGNRKCICVQLDESVAKESIAAKQGYETIAEIAMDRIRRYILSQHPLGHTPESGFKAFKLIKDLFDFNMALPKAHERAKQMVNYGLYSRFGLSEAQRIDKALLGCLGEIAFERLLKNHRINYRLDETDFENNNSDEFDFIINGHKIDVKVAKKSTGKSPNDKWTYGYPAEQKPKSKDYIIIGWVDFKKEAVDFYGWISGKEVAVKPIIEQNAFAGYKYLTPNHEFKWGELNKNLTELFQLLNESIKQK